MTKSYEDGIIDAIKVLEPWKYIGIVSAAIYTIESQLTKLLPPEYLQTKQLDITKDDK